MPQNLELLQVPAITLETVEIEVVIRPDLGARIDRLLDKRTGHDWIWHPPHYDSTQTRTIAIGESFDQHWTGGWDEIFPNDAAGEFQGRQLVDHGEFWSGSWAVLEHKPDCLTLGLTCHTVPIQIQKTIRVEKAEIQLGYEFKNLSDQPVSFLFKQHAAIAIEAGDEIILPDCDIEPVVLDFSRIIGQPGKTKFPTALDKNGEVVYLNQTPASSSQLQEFYYSSGLSIGQCGVRNPRSRSSLLMNFSLSDFPYVWMFQSYGGWNDYYVLVMEPCTTMPYDLEIAERNGTIATLEPYQIQYRQLKVKLERD